MSASPESLAARIRAKHPGAYDDMDDAALESKVLAKHPQYADLASTATSASSSMSAAFDINRVRNDLNSAYRQKFGTDIRVTSEGQDAYHRSKGLNHQGKIDVGLGQESPEQREFVANWLRTNRIPHKIFTRALPGTPISGPHAHIGSGNGEVDFKPYGGATPTPAPQARGSNLALVPPTPGTEAPPAPRRAAIPPLSAPPVDATIIPTANDPALLTRLRRVTTPDGELRGDEFAPAPQSVRAQQIPVASDIVSEQAVRLNQQGRERAEYRRKVRDRNTIIRQNKMAEAANVIAEARIAAGIGNPEGDPISRLARHRGYAALPPKPRRPSDLPVNRRASIVSPRGVQVTQDIPDAQGQNVPQGNREMARVDARVGLPPEDQALREGQLGQLRASGRVMRPIYEGLQGSAGSTLTQLGNTLKILDRYSAQYHLVPGLAEKIAEAGDYLRNKGRLNQETSAISAAETDAEAKGILDSLATDALRIGGSLPLELTKIGLIPGGAITKFGTLGALSEDDVSPTSLARGGAKGGAVGALFKVAPKIGLAPGTAAVASGTYATEKIAGSSDEEAKRAAVTNTLFHLAGQVRTVGFRQGDRVETRRVTYDNEGQPQLGGRVEAKPDIELALNSRTGVYEPRALREAPRQLRAAPDATEPSKSISPAAPNAPTGAAPPSDILPEPLGTSAPTSEQAATAAPVVRVRHSNPEIDGGRVIKRENGKVIVENKDNPEVTHTIKDPRRGGNREAALVREDVTQNQPQPIEQANTQAQQPTAQTVQSPQSEGVVASPSRVAVKESMPVQSSQKVMDSKAVSSPATLQTGGLGQSRVRAAEMFVPQESQVRAKRYDFHSALLDAEHNDFRGVPLGFSHGRLDPAQENEIREAIGALPEAVQRDIAADFNSGDTSRIRRAQGFLTNENIEALARYNQTVPSTERARAVEAKARPIYPTEQRAAAPQVEPPQREQKAPTEFQRTGIKKVISRATDPLWLYAQKAGGVDTEGMYAGEIRRYLSPRESQRIGITKRGGMPVEYMMDAANVEGYRDPRTGRPFEDIGRFIEALSESAMGTRETYRQDAFDDTDFVKEEERHYAEIEKRLTTPEQEEVEGLVAVLNNDDEFLDLHDIIREGKADDSQINRFKELGRYYKIERQADRIIAEGQSLASETPLRREPVKTETRPENQGRPLASSSRQLGFIAPELIPQYEKPTNASRERVEYAQRYAEHQALENVFGKETLLDLEGLLEPDSQVRHLVQSVIKRVNQFAKAGTNGQAIAEDLTAALSKLNELRHSKTPVFDYLNQGSLFEMPELTTTQQGMLRALDRNPRSADSLLDSLLGEVAKAKSEVEQGALFSAAWHGSPHRFDKFSSEKIGTGEGAQSYGYGLYFTDTEDIARHYRDTLARPHNKPERVIIDGTDFIDFPFKDDKEHSHALEALTRFRYYNPEKVDVVERVRADLEATVKNLPEHLKTARHDFQKREMERQLSAARGALEFLNKHKIQYEPATKVGALYHVELAPKEDEYLLWDKPLSEQSEKVKAALKDVITWQKTRDNVWTLSSEAAISYVKEEGAYKPYFHDRQLSDRNTLTAAQELIERQLTGEDVYGVVAERQGGQAYHAASKVASDYLHSLGIRGIKYLDQGSRGAGEGSYNYVIFSDQDVEIKEILAKHAQDYFDRAKELTSTPIPTVLAGAKVDIRGHVVRLNPEAYVIMAGAYSRVQYERSGEYPKTPGFTGLFAEPGVARSIAKVLNDVAGFYPEQKAKAELLRDAVRRAAERDGTMILLSDESAALHEEFHRASFKASRVGDDISLRGRHGDFQRLVNSPEYAKAKPYLLEYYADNDGVLVEELAAHIAEGNLEAVGLSADEGANYLLNWTRSLVKKNGTISLNHFEETTDETRQILNRVKEESTGRSLQGLSRQPASLSRRSAQGDEKTFGREGQRPTADAAKAQALASPRNQIDTPEFKQWFGDSKVVGKDGKPLVVYHGTNSSAFKEFDKARIGKSGRLPSSALGFFFQSTNQVRAAYGKNIIQAYLKMERPYHMTLDVLDGLTDDEVSNLKKRLTEERFDGVIATGWRYTEYVVFEPTQIKSASGNRGTFSPTDPNILRSALRSRKSEAGFVNTQFMADIPRGALNLVNLSRSLTTALDLSAGLRQGKMGLLRHPVIFARAFLTQFKGFKTPEYEKIIKQIQLAPDAELMEASGLYLASRAQAWKLLGEKEPEMNEREEAFFSEWADEIPGVKHSQQAYNLMLDVLRVGWFREYTKHLRKLKLTPENAEQAFKGGAELINAATGRGNLGRYGNMAAPVLSAGFFSPRFWASRLKILSIPIDPRTYMQMRSRGGRAVAVEQFKTLFSFAALVALSLFLAKLSGATIDLDKNSPDFLRARWGKLQVDFSAGFQTHIRAAMRIAEAIYKSNYKGEKVDKFHTAGAIAGTYFRGKEAPAASLAHDLFFSEKDKSGRGKDIIGDPVYATGEPGTGLRNRLLDSAIGKRVFPMVWQDANQAYNEMGWKGVGITLPLTMVGEGVQTFERKQPKSSSSSALPSPRPPLPRPRVGIPK